MEHLRHGRFRAAAECFESGRAAAPGDPALARRAAEARLGLGLASLHAGDLGAARDEIERARAHRPDLPGAALHLARIHHRCGLPSRALAALDSEAAGRRAEVHLLRAACLDRLGESSAARAALERGLASAMGVASPAEDLEPARRPGPGEETAPAAIPAVDHADAHVRLAGAVVRRDRRAAARHLEVALRLNPLFLRARLALAVVSLQLGETEGALTLLERARELEPAFPDVLAWLGLARLRTGDTSGAARALEAATGMRRGFGRAHRILALTRHAEGRTQEALEEARLGCARESELSDPVAGRRPAGLETDAADRDELARTLAIAPGCPDLHLALGCRLSEDHAPAPARAAFLAALALHPVYPQARFELARLELSAGRLGEAEALMARVTEERPAWVDAQAALGRIRRLKGDARGAVLPLRAALRRRSGLAQARADLAWALDELKRSTTAGPLPWWEPLAV